MPRFRKRPVEIEAIQLAPSNLIELTVWCKDLFVEDDLEVYISTLEGDMHVSENDWVIKGVHGEFYPCKPDIFEKSYELVTD